MGDNLSQRSPTDARSLLPGAATDGQMQTERGALPGRHDEGSPYLPLGGGVPLAKKLGGELSTTCPSSHTPPPTYKVNKHCHTWERRENVSVSCCEGRQLENETPESVLLPSVLSWEELRPPLPPQDSHAEVLTLGTRMSLYLQMEPFKR